MDCDHRAATDFLMTRLAEREGARGREHGGRGGGQRAGASKERCSEDGSKQARQPVWAHLGDVTGVRILQCGGIRSALSVCCVACYMWYGSLLLTCSHTSYMVCIGRGGHRATSQPDMFRQWCRSIMGGEGV